MQKFKEFFSNKAVIINCSIPALIIALYLILFLPPKIKELTRLLPEASRLKTKLITLEKEWANIDSFNKRISDLYEKLDFYERKLPSEKEIPAILKYLSDSAKNLNVKITEIKPIKEKDKRTNAAIYEQVPILLLAECGYHQLGRFLSKLESADRFMKIEQIKILSNPRQTHRHSVRLTVVTYVMKK